MEAVRKHSPATVEVLSGVGKGVPDLMVGVNGKNLLWEIKGPGGKLTPDQERWHKAWMGKAVVISTVWEALSMAGVDLRTAAEIDQHYRDRYPGVFGGEEAVGTEEGTRG